MNSARVRLIVRIIGILFICGGILLFTYGSTYGLFTISLAGLLIILRSFTIRKDVTMKTLSEAFFR